MSLSLDQQLRELWQAGDDKVTRASLFNLVTVADAPAARDSITATLQLITPRHPCRAIVVLAEPAAPGPGELATSVTALCHLGGGGKQVCCEQIQIHATGPQVAQVSSILLPLLEADLPTIVWWPGNFLRHHDLACRLRAVADRWLFDTAGWDDVPLAALSQIIRMEQRCRFADFSWARLALWRGLLADCFDEPLGMMDRLTITHGTDPGSRVGALLFAGWVATQLGWSIEGATDHITLYHNLNASGGLLAVELAGPTVSVTLRVDLARGVVTAAINQLAACGLPRHQAFMPLDTVTLLSQELDHPLPPAVYERALAAAALLAEMQLSVNQSPVSPALK